MLLILPIYTFFFFFFFFFEFARHFESHLARAPLFNLDVGIIVHEITSTKQEQKMYLARSNVREKGKWENNNMVTVQSS